MTPRLSTSVAKNKTKLPPDSLKLISESFAEIFADFLKDKQVITEGFLYLDELILRLGFKEPGALRQYNFEVSMEYSREDKEDVMEKIYSATDALQSMVQQYVEADGDIEFPTQWKSFDYEDKNFWARVSTENGDLEAQADALLGAEFLEEQEKAAGIDEDFVDELFAKLRNMKLQQH